VGPINLRIRYRPVRIGWCIKTGDLAEFREVARLSHAFCGGRFNPIIPLGDEAAAKRLIETFQVDCLHCISQTSEGDQLLKDHRHLEWPHSYKELFVDYWGRGPKTAAFLDVLHTVRQLYENNIKGQAAPTFRAKYFKWSPSDPLADVFLATFGAYPNKDRTGNDYEELFRRVLRAEEIDISSSPIPPDAYAGWTPSALTICDLAPTDFAVRDGHPGIYYGSSSDFADLVNYWNLRAGGRQVLFYDPVFHERMIETASHFLNALRQRPEDPFRVSNSLTIWNNNRDTAIDIALFGERLTRSSVSEHSKYGCLPASLMGFRDQAVLGARSSGDRPSFTFELPPKPFFPDDTLHGQSVVVSIRPLVAETNAVFTPPYFPLLNQYYGRHAHFKASTARSEKESLGIITAVTDTSITMRALDVRSLVKNIFEKCGIEAKPSKDGLVGLRLIEQMGGLQGCRAFKVSGVRDLIQSYPPESWFTRSGAVEKIRKLDPVTKQPQFDDYKTLYIDGKHPKPEELFRSLVKKNVFRVGLCFVCPGCELEAWVHLDDARTNVSCEYCGKSFNVTPQLKDRDWAYRRSGLFGRNDNQGGGIPVSLALMQLVSVLHENVIAFTTGTDLNHVTAGNKKCESDFVLIAQEQQSKHLQIVIGECKSDGGEITANDVQNLSAVADALRSVNCDSFIVFAKTSAFTAEEIERCRGAQAGNGHRVILLAKRELEPYDPYELAEKEFEIRQYTHSLGHMGQNTHAIYFEPRPKKAVAAGSDPE
jgi:hypothetical protein